MKKITYFALAMSLAFVAPNMARADDSKPADPKSDDQKKEDPAPTPPQKEDPGQGRGNRQRGQRGQRGSMADRLKEALGLTDDQVTKVKKIEEEARAADKKAHENDPKEQAPDRSKMRDRMKEVNDGIIAKVRDVLTDEQKTKLDDFLKKQEENRKKRQDQQQKQKQT
jgi:hypothetical protein